MHRKWLHLVCIVLLLLGCQDQRHVVADLNSLKQQFLTSIFSREIDEGPFNFSYQLRTVFFSNEIVSLFGEFNAYSYLPHGYGWYEGRTFCKIKGQFKEIALNELFTTPSQKEYVRSYCEEELKKKQTTYLSVQGQPFGSLRQEDIHTYVIDDQFLIIIFPPYVAGNYVDGPVYVKIPYACLKGRWNDSGVLPSLLDKVMTSKSFVASWNND